MLYNVLDFVWHARSLASRIAAAAAACGGATHRHLRCYLLSLQPGSILVLTSPTVRWSQCLLCQMHVQPVAVHFLALIGIGIGIGKRLLPIPR